MYALQINIPERECVYRVLSDKEDPKNGLSARYPDAIEACVHSHINGLKRSPYISTTASLKAAKAYQLKAIERYKKKQRQRGLDISYNENQFRTVRIDIGRMLEDGLAIELFDLSKENVRDEYLDGNRKLKNFARKDEEVLIKGYIPAEYVEEIDIDKEIEKFDRAHIGFIPELYLYVIVLCILVDLLKLCSTYYRNGFTPMTCRNCITMDLKL